MPVTGSRRFTQLAGVAAVVAVVGVVGGSRAAAGTVNEAGGTLRLQLPAPTGPRLIGTRTLYLVDRSRRESLAPTSPRRRLVVQLWYPTATDGGVHSPYASPGI